MDDDDFSFFDDGPDDSFLWDEPESETDETTENVSTRSIRITAKREMNRVERRQELKNVIAAPPKLGEQIHIVAANKFNFWDWVPVMIDWIGPLRHLYCATWTANLVSVRNLFRLMDESKIKEANFLLGTYFKRREPAVYAGLREGLLQRKGRIKCFETREGDVIGYSSQEILHLHRRIGEFDGQPASRTIRHHQRQEALGVSSRVV